jgi:hypothetical protein
MAALTEAAEFATGAAVAWEATLEAIAAGGALTAPGIVNGCAFVAGDCCGALDALFVFALSADSEEAEDDVDAVFVAALLFGVVVGVLLCDELCDASCEPS